MRCRSCKAEMAYDIDDATGLAVHVCPNCGFQLLDEESALYKEAPDDCYYYGHLFHTESSHGRTYERCMVCGTIRD